MAQSSRTGGRDVARMRIRDGLDEFTSKWHPLILDVIRRQEGASYTAIERELSDISAKMLSSGLAALAEAGLIERRTRLDGATTDQYVLTPSGRRLGVVLDMVETWWAQHAADPLALIVDDEPMAGELLEEFLADSWRTRYVQSGRAAIEAYAPAVDVVVLDRGLSERSGAAVARELRAIDERALILALTAGQPEANVVDLPVDDYLRKPIRRAAFVEHLDRLVLRRNLDGVSRRYLQLASKARTLRRTYGTGVTDIPEYRMLHDARRRVPVAGWQAELLDRLVPE